jgi:hypothetical protein
MVTANQGNGRRLALDDGVRLALNLSDAVAHLGSYALTNQTRSERAALQVVQAFETLGTSRLAETSFHAIAVDAIDSLMRLKKLLSTPSTVRTVPTPVRTAILEDLASLECHAAALVRATTGSASRTPSRRAP